MKLSHGDEIIQRLPLAGVPEESRGEGVDSIEVGLDERTVSEDKYCQIILPG